MAQKYNQPLTGCSIQQNIFLNMDLRATQSLSGLYIYISSIYSTCIYNYIYFLSNWGLKALFWGITVATWYWFEGEKM